MYNIADQTEEGQEGEVEGEGVKKRMLRSLYLYQ
jgi:hypothetical protein